MRRRRQAGRWMAVGAILCCLWTPDAHARKAAASVGDQRFVMTTSRGYASLLIVADRPIDARAPDVTRLLVTIHGLKRNVKGYFRAAAEIAGAPAGRGTMVVAPDFPIEEDVQAFRLPRDVLFWSSRGWKEAQPALGPVPVSSYAALDALLAHFADRTRYPALREMVVIGHSAGGQVVQRYAVTNQIEDRLRAAGIRLRYVVANPSSYVYLTQDRPGRDGRFGPVDARRCRNFAQWKYGLQDLPAYAAGRSAGEIGRTFAARNVTYLLGMNDTDPKDDDLDKSCAAQLEGPNRLMRGLYFHHYLGVLFGTALRHRVVQVPGVGHDEQEMYGSPCGRAVLFDQPIPPTCPSSVPARADVRDRSVRQ